MANKNSDRFTALSHIWPEGPDQLIADLSKLSFECKYHSDAAKALIEAHWDKLHIPRSLESECADALSYCYLKERKRNFRAESWGMVLASNKPDLQNSLSEAAPAILMNEPDAAMDYVLKKVHPDFWTGKSEKLPSHVCVEANVVVGPGCEFGENVILESGVRIGAHVKIAANTRVGAHSCVYDYCEVGSNCEIKAHCVVGGLGFGFLHYPKMPRVTQRRHVGRVVIEDFVRLGTFVGVDRGVFEDTVIKSGSALDNFVQVAHNCELGVNNVLCGFVGLSGSTKIGNQVTMGGMSATKGHLSIGDNCMIAGQTGVNSNLKPNSVVKGYPPRPVSEALRIEVLAGKLPEMYEKLKKLEKKLES